MRRHLKLLGRSFFPILVLLVFVIGSLAMAKSPEFQTADPNHPRVRDLHAVAYRLEVNLGWWPYLLAQAERSSDSLRVSEALNIESYFERYNAHLLAMYDGGTVFYPLLSHYRKQFAFDQALAEERTNRPKQGESSKVDIARVNLRISEAKLDGLSRQLYQELKEMRTSMHAWFRTAIREEVALAQKAYQGWSIAELQEAQGKIIQTVQAGLGKGNSINFEVIQAFMRISAKLMDRAWDEADLVSETYGPEYIYVLSRIAFKQKIERESANAQSAFKKKGIFRRTDPVKLPAVKLDPLEALQAARESVKAFWDVLEVNKRVAPLLQVRGLEGRGQSVWYAIQSLQLQATHDLDLSRFPNQNKLPWSAIESVRRERHPSAACVWLLEQERAATPAPLDL